MAGYAGTMLHCDLNARTTTKTPTADYANDYLGGRGLATRLYWEQSLATGRSDPLVIATGALAGFPGLAASRWVMCGHSPVVEPAAFNVNNLGGSWGAHLKFAGCDALVISGQSSEPVYLYIHDGVCEFKSANHLWGGGAAETRERLKTDLGHGVRVLAIGPAGQNRVSLATVLADEDSCGAGGIGAAMGAKNLKAVAVCGDFKPTAADPAALAELTDFLKEIKLKSPGKTFAAPPGMQTRRQICYGCIIGCDRSSHRTPDGRSGKYMCASGPVYESFAKQHYGRLNQVPFEANRLCDDHGLDTNAILIMLEWLDRCHKAGVLSERTCGLPLETMGSLDFIRKMLHMISHREGFGDILAQGTRQAAGTLGPQAQALLGDQVGLDGTYIYYHPRLYLANALLFALEPRHPLAMAVEIGGTVLRWLGTKQPEIDTADVEFIARRFWNSPQAADYSTCEGKAEAARRVQDRIMVKESAGTCLFSWNVCMVELFRPDILAEVLKAVTGNVWTGGGLDRLGERLANLQRAVMIHDGRSGRDGDTLPDFCFDTPLENTFNNPELLVPGPQGRPVSRKGATLDRNDFEQLKTEYYRLRGWDAETGLPTEDKLKALGLADVPADLIPYGGSPAGT